MSIEDAVDGETGELLGVVGDAEPPPDAEQDEDTLVNDDEEDEDDDG